MRFGFKRWQNALFLEQLLELAVLVHCEGTGQYKGLRTRSTGRTAQKDIASTNELSVDIQLRNGRPVAAPVSDYIQGYWTIGTHENSLMSDLNCESSNTLNDLNFSGGTPCISRIWIAALEKPHCGCSGVPFMNSTTGVDSTARERFCRASSVMNRRAMANERGGSTGATRSGENYGRASATRRQRCTTRRYSQMRGTLS